MLSRTKNIVYHSKLKKVIDDRVKKCWKSGTKYRQFQWTTNRTLYHYYQ